MKLFSSYVMSSPGLSWQCVLFSLIIYAFLLITLARLLECSMYTYSKDYCELCFSVTIAVRVEQADKFNDPQSPCNILVATDAIGMGLNL